VLITLRRLCTSPHTYKRCLLKQVHLPASLRVKKSSSPVLAAGAVPMLPHRPALAALVQRVGILCYCLVPSICAHVTALLCMCAPDCDVLMCRLCTSPCTDNRCLLKQVHLPASLRVKKSMSLVLAPGVLQNQMLQPGPSMFSIGHR
jgi:hypothetical protein